MTKQRVRNNLHTRDVNAASRAALAIQLRAQSLTYDEIARRCGYGTAQSAHKAVQRELNRVVVTNIEELRKEELASLNQLEATCWQRLNDEEYAGGKLFAVDRILQIKERRAKLMGLDMKPEEAMRANAVVIREVVQGYFSVQEQET
jgi:hypothetical protein